ncbi:MAG: endolytic transglycosylase MltG [Parvibaculaceae bacterium]
MNSGAKTPDQQQKPGNGDKPETGTANRSWLKWTLVAVAAVVFLLGAGAGGIYYYGQTKFLEPGPATADQVFLLERGTGLNATAARLEKEGLVSSSLVFRLALRVQGAAGSLKAGEYLIPAQASMDEIAAILAEGKSIQHKLTIAEGLTSWEVMRLVETDPVLVGDMPETPPEGALLPETYLFTRGTTRADIVERMKAAHDEVLDQLWQERATDLPFDTKEEAVTLASIVEKETGIASERPRVAAVFVNRLRKGMRLQSDPTIIYGITKGQGPLGRPIRRSEIDRKTAYNTYQIDGLPPAPIANPGEASLAAVLNPPETKEYYFVADGTGGHAFAETHAGHMRNVAKWRRIERARNR